MENRDDNTYGVRCAHLLLTLDVGIVVSQQHVPVHIFIQHQSYYSPNSCHKYINGQWSFGSDNGHLTMVINNQKHSSAFVSCQHRRTGQFFYRRAELPLPEKIFWQCLTQKYIKATNANRSNRQTGRPIIVEQWIGNITKQSGIFRWEEAAGDLINTLLQLWVVLVVVTRVVAKQSEQYNHQNLCTVCAYSRTD